MSRSVQWRRIVSDACNWHQTQAMEATIYLLRQTGPTGFLLKEEGETKTVKVYLGDPHSCTCVVFKKERDLCKHICWLLLRKFRLSQNDPLSWQLGLVEREVNEILQGRNTAPQPSQARQSKTKTEESTDGRSIVQQRAIEDDDVCPICQDELLSKKLPVTYCRFGCGNTIHIKCMSVWAEHQQKTSQDKSIKCPMCREDFGTIEALKTESRNAGVQQRAPHGVRLDRHSGIACSHCSRAPIEGKCYKCTACDHFHLCQRCFNLPVHTNHAFQFRQKRNQRWRAATRTLGASLPPAIVNDMMNRDLSEEDYDSLLLLDRNADAELSTLTEEAVQRLPIERVRERSSLLSPGAQCRICLRGFLIGQFLRRLPCQHKFHKDCIDNWLLHSHATCPIDGLVALRNEPQQRNASNSASQREPQPPTSTDIAANGLTINAMGIPISSNRLNQGNDGSNSTLRRPPRIPLNVQPTTPQSLEVAGARIAGSDESYSIDNRNHTEEPREECVPGERLLQQARLHRQRISHQLNNLNRDDGDSHMTQIPLTLSDLIDNQPRSAGSSLSVMPSSDIIEPNDLINLANFARRTSTGSANSVGSGRERRSDDQRLPRGRIRSIPTNGLLRQRPSSTERAIPSIQSATQNMRDLFLGNDPARQPAVNGDMPSTVSKHPLRGLVRPTRQRTSTHTRRHQQVNGQHVDGHQQEPNRARNFQLEGFSID